MRVMRANATIGIETIVVEQRETRVRTPIKKWCVRRITIEPSADTSTGRKKGPDNAAQGRIFRAGIDITKGEGPSTAPTARCCSITCRADRPRRSRTASASL